jgi:hypothetical protein
MPQSYAPIIAGAGGILLEAPDTLPSSGVLALAVDAAGKMSSVAFPETTRETLGLATTDSPTFAGATLTGQLGLNGFAKIGGVSAGVAAVFQNDGTTLGTLQVSKISAGGVAITINSVADITGVRSITNGNNAVFGPGPFISGVNQLNSQPASGLTLGNANGVVVPGSATFGGTVEVRNGTNGQKSRLYKTYTSATSGEWLELDAATDASNFDIAASIGSAGGTARGIRIGSKDAAGTFASWLSFSTAGAATFSGFMTVNSSVMIAASNNYSWNGRSIIYSPANGRIQLTNTSSNDFDRLMLGGTTSSFPAIKRNGTAINFRLADDSADAPITASNITASGAVQLGNAAVAETPTATHTLIVKDSTGTSYRVLAVAV